MVKLRVPPLDGVARPACAARKITSPSMDPVRSGAGQIHSRTRLRGRADRRANRHEVPLLRRSLTPPESCSGPCAFTLGGRFFGDVLKLHPVALAVGRNTLPFCSSCSAAWLFHLASLAGSGLPARNSHGAARAGGVEAHAGQRPACLHRGSAPSARLSARSADAARRRSPFRRIRWFSSATRFRATATSFSTAPAPARPRRPRWP